MKIEPKDLREDSIEGVKGKGSLSDDLKIVGLNNCKDGVDGSGEAEPKDEGKKETRSCVSDINVYDGVNWVLT